MADRLPIYDIESDILSALKATKRLVLQAPTGSGKSTQVPQMLLKHGLLGDGQVVILQPRRLAARLLAHRVAFEMGVQAGREVGYQVRFENFTSDVTRIKFETEGILLRRLLNDPKLQGVQALIFDEFHERHLYGDITLARALELQETLRPDLLILVMSATLDAGALEDFMWPCTMLASQGRVFPVHVEYLPHRLGENAPPPWELAADAFIAHVRSGGSGDVLVFMPGGYEISQTLEALRNSAESRGYILLPLHGELPPRDQDAAVARYDQPKVVVATNVAETSVTIDGVKLVIDSGLARLARYDANRGINTLLIEKISQSSSDQRAGRAGRTSPGKCVRLWSRPEHDERAPHELPEIKRLDLAEIVLTLKAAGVGDLRKFRWLEKPDEIALAHAEELLTDLGALGHDGHISELGRRMLAFPVHPRYSRMLLAAQDHGCVHQACLVAALTQGRDLLQRNVGKDVRDYREDLLGEKASSDFWILMRAWTYAVKHNFRPEPCRRLGIHMVTARQVGPLLDQFLRIAKDEGLDTAPRDVPDDALQKCILIGFSDRVARRVDQGTLRCELVHGRRGVLARESCVTHTALFVAAEVREIEGRDDEVRTLLSLATAVEEPWLREVFPGDFEATQHVAYDSRERRVQAAEIVKFRGLALSARRLGTPPPEAAARLLAAEVVAGRVQLERWDHSVEQWLQRLQLLCTHCPELNLPPISDENRQAIIEQICLGATSARDLRDKEVKPAVVSWLSDAQRQSLDKHAPERLTLANGRTPKVTYAPGVAPYVSMRIQDLYDVNQTPRIALGRVAVLVHILSPGNKPVQVTQDLASFWSSHYPRLKSELQRKYPKHEWR
ncbi:MAG: ATP-dependent helicase HrpB [Verrucomicrobia bacterium]|nr:ATP-dependent helicase HrpB [Verrucomicrobiota bacterium]